MDKPELLEAPEKMLFFPSDAELKYKAMQQWKRKMNAKLTVARHYLEHPDRKIKDEDEALEAWVARAADRIIRM